MFMHFCKTHAIRIVYNNNMCTLDSILSIYWTQNNVFMYLEILKHTAHNN